MSDNIHGIANDYCGTAVAVNESRVVVSTIGNVNAGNCYPNGLTYYPASDLIKELMNRGYISNRPIQVGERFEMIMEVNMIPSSQNTFTSGGVYSMYDNESGRQAVANMFGNVDGVYQTKPSDENSKDIIAVSITKDDGTIIYKTPDLSKATTNQLFEEIRKREGVQEIVVHLMEPVGYVFDMANLECTTGPCSILVVFD